MDHTAASPEVRHSIVTYIPMIPPIIVHARTLLSLYVDVRGRNAVSTRADGRYELSQLPEDQD